MTGSNLWRSLRGKSSMNIYEVSEAWVKHEVGVEAKTFWNIVSIPAS